MLFLGNYFYKKAPPYFERLVISISFTDAVAVAEEVALAAAVANEHVIVRDDDNNGGASHNGDACEMADVEDAAAMAACPAQWVI